MAKKLLFDQQNKTLYTLSETDVNNKLLENLIKEKGFTIKKIDKLEEFIEILQLPDEHSLNEENKLKHEVGIIKENIPENLRDYFTALIPSINWILSIMERFYIGFTMFSGSNYILYNEVFQNVTDLSEDDIKKLIPGDLASLGERTNFRSNQKKLIKNKFQEFSGEISFITKYNEIKQGKYFTYKHVIENHPMLVGFYYVNDHYNLRDEENNTYLNLIIRELNNMLAKIIKINNLKPSELENNKRINNKIQKTETLNNTQLTHRELEVLDLICRGFTNREIAKKLYISKRTVESHRANLLDKTHSRNTADLIRFAINNNLID